MAFRVILCEGRVVYKEGIPPLSWGCDAATSIHTREPDHAEPSLSTRAPFHTRHTRRFLRATVYYAMTTVSDVASFHTESTVPDAKYYEEHPMPRTEREEFVQRAVGLPVEEQVAFMAGALYDFRDYTKLDIEQLVRDMTKRFDSLENLLRGFVAEVRVIYDANPN